MSSITPAEFAAMQLRTERNAGRLPPCDHDITGCRKESALHDQIMDECDRRGWIYFHGSMAHRTFRTGGEPDFVILRNPRSEVCPNCRQAKLISEFSRCLCNAQMNAIPETLLIECKTATGKLTEDQQDIAAHARRLGHTIHVVRSFEQFQNLL